MSTYLAIPRGCTFNRSTGCLVISSCIQREKLLLTHSIFKSARRYLSGTTGTTSTAMSRKQYEGTCLPPRGNPMPTHCVLDARAMEATSKSMRRLQTGILILCNKAPIIWLSKGQNIETSTFGSKFQAMKNAVELIEALRYKLRMFGVPIEGAMNIFCNNEAVCDWSLPPAILNHIVFKELHQRPLKVVHVH
jgi:hypothetical protein